MSLVGLEHKGGDWKREMGEGCGGDKRLTLRRAMGLSTHCHLSHNNSHFGCVSPRFAWRRLGLRCLACVEMLREWCGFVCLGWGLAC